MPSSKVNEKPHQYSMEIIDPVKNSAYPALISPWTFIGLAFAAQVAGSIVVSVLLGLTLREVAWPIALLIVGGIHAFIVRFWLSANYTRWKQHWVPAAFYSGFIFLLSHSSFAQTTSSIDTNSFHPLEYAALGLFLCWMGHTLLRTERAWGLALRVFAGGMLFAVLDELHQSFVPYRTPSFADLLLDGIGLALGIGFFFLTGHFWGAWEKNVKSD